MTLTSAPVVVAVRPRGQLVRTGLLSLAVAMIPLTGAAWAAAVAGANWRFIIGMQITALVLGVAAAARWSALRTRVTADHLEGNGFLSPRIRIPLREIGAAHLVPTYGPSGEVVTQLLITDAHGRRLFRRRGSFWTDEALQAIASALPVPVERIPEPISMRAFWRSHPDASYWFEDSTIARALTAASVLLLSLLLAAGTLAVMH